jgi:hypothetical protein
VSAAERPAETAPPPASPPPPIEIVPEQPPGPEQLPGEVGGPKGPEPTRYGDWEKAGRVSDF